MMQRVKPHSLFASFTSKCLAAGRQTTNASQKPLVCCCCGLSACCADTKCTMHKQPGKRLRCATLFVVEAATTVLRAAIVARTRSATRYACLITANTKHNWSADMPAGSLWVRLLDQRSQHRWRSHTSSSASMPLIFCNALGLFADWQSLTASS